MYRYVVWDGNGCGTCDGKGNRMEMEGNGVGEKRYGTENGT
jgi:hypothetical protein